MNKQKRGEPNMVLCNEKVLKRFFKKWTSGSRWYSRSSCAYLLLRAPKAQLAIEKLLTEDAGPTKERYPTPEDKEAATMRQIHFKCNRNQTSCFEKKKV